MDYDLLSDDFYNNPYPILSDMRRNAPCWYDHRLGAYVLTRYGDISRVLQGADFSAQRVRQFTRGAPEHLQTKVEHYVSSLERWILFNDPPKHAPLRSRLQKAFGPHLLPVISAAAANAVDDALGRLSEASETDLIATYAYPVPTHVLASVFGIAESDIERFKQWTTDIFTLIGAGVADDHAVEAGYRGVCELKDYVLNLLDEKRRHPSNDMLSALAAPPLPEEDEIDEDDVVGLFMSMIVAGHETSTNLIGNSLRAAMLDPVARERLAAPEDIDSSVVEEFVRFDGPVASMLRRAKRDITLCGMVIPEGSFLFSMLIAGNRDPRKYANPDRLDLGRPLEEHLGFGVGMHRCVGAFMARVVVAKAIQEFLRAFPDATVGDNVVWLKNTSFRGMAAMPVALGLRSRRIGDWTSR